MTELYVGNLLYEVTIEEVQGLFRPFGAIYAVDLLTAPGPDRPHAYAFVRMDNDAAQDAIRTLNGTAFMGRTLRVEVAKAESVPGR